MQPADREGTFNATITDFGLKEFQSGAVAIAIRVKLDAIWNGESFEGWSQFEQEADGDVWIIKKDGAVNELGAKSLMANAGWDGNIESVSNGSWQPTECSVSIKREDYNGTTRYKVSFVNAHNKPPSGSLSNIDPDKAKSLANRYGPQMRAIAGNVVRNGAPSVGQPPKPPAKPAPPPAPAATEEKIPF